MGGRMRRASSFCVFLCVFSLVSLSGMAFAQRPRTVLRAALEAPATVVDVLRDPIPPSMTQGGYARRGESDFYRSSVGGRYSSQRPAENYAVGVRNVTWRGRDAKSYSALAYHPATPPVGDVKFSVVIFSHGLGASAESFSYLANAWAERGNLVLLLRHPTSDESVWRGKLRPMAELKDAYRKHWSGRDRARAIIAALDLVYSWKNEGTGLGADLDLSRIAVAGNDLGALAALMVAGQLPPDNGPSLKDPRVASVLAMSPPVFCSREQGAIVYSQITVPVMVVTGTHDDGVVGSTKAYQRRMPYDSVRNVDRYLVILQGADHRVYGGLRISSQRQASDAPYQETILIETSDYFSAYLRDDAFRLASLRARGSVEQFANANVEHSPVSWRTESPITANALEGRYD